MSEHLRQQVLGSLGGDLGAKIEVLPNIVDLADIPFTERASGAALEGLDLDREAPPEQISQDCVIL